MNSLRLRGFAAYLLPAILYCAFIYFLSSLQAPPTPTFGFEWGDKITHAGAFGLMMLFAFRAFQWITPDRSRGWHLGFAILFCSIYGALDEVHQYYVPGRDCDPLDWVADSIGALLALAPLLILLRWKLGRLLFLVQLGRGQV